MSAVANDKEEVILTLVQLLSINFIMDTFGALVLATEPANPGVLGRQPEKKTIPLISAARWRMIVGQAVYQLTVVMVLDFPGGGILGYTTSEDADRLNPLIFDVYVWIQSVL